MIRTFYLSILIPSFILMGTISFIYGNEKADSDWTRRSLQRISKEMEEIEGEIKEKGMLLEKERGRHQQRVLEKDLAKLVSEKGKSLQRFLSTASGVDLNEIKWDEFKKKKDFFQELQNLLLPLVDGLQRASARPRKIEGLKNLANSHREKIEILESGVKNIDELIDREKSRPHPSQDLISKLESSTNSLRKRLADYQFRIEEVNRALDYELSQGKSLKEASTEILKGFFGRRGKNFLLAIFIFVFSLWGGLRFKIFEFPVKMIRNPQLFWLKRPLRLVQSILAFFFAFALSLITLYLLNDWALLTFFTLILLSIVWSLKQLVPKFLNEARFLLNLGTVKEGERVIWKGVPYWVKSLGPTSILVNEKLQGGWIRVAAKDLSREYSRPLVENEPWFPTTKGDFISLGADIIGEVILQTPEQVVVRNWDKSLKYFISSEFIKETPTNLSQGFALIGEFSMGHKGEKEIHEVVTELENLFKGRLKEGDFGMVDAIIDYKLLSHSTCFSYRVFLEGKMAAKKVFLEREVAMIFLSVAQNCGLFPSKIRFDFVKD